MSELNKDKYTWDVVPLGRRSSPRLTWLKNPKTGRNYTQDEIDAIDIEIWGSIRGWEKQTSWSGWWDDPDYLAAKQAFHNPPRS